MKASFPARSFAALAIAISVCPPAFAQNILGKGQTGPVPDPVNLEAKGLFQDRFVTVGDDMFIAGQPTERGLRELRAKGVSTVVNLRMPVRYAPSNCCKETAARSTRASSPGAAEDAWATYLSFYRGTLSYLR